MEKVHNAFCDLTQWYHVMMMSYASFRRVAGTIEKFDADPESKMGKKVPDWLGALMEAFDKSRVSTEPQPNGALKQTPFTVGGFAVYLGGQMLAAKDGQLTATESEALSTVSVHRHCIL